MEATGHAGWFERLLAELGFELWIGDPAQIKAKRVRKQKTRAWVDDGEFSTRAKWRAPRRAGSSVLKKLLTLTTLLEMDV